MILPLFRFWGRNLSKFSLRCTPSVILSGFDHFLGSGAEICQIFRCFFGKFKKIKKTFWNLLTFSTRKLRGYSEEQTKVTTELLISGIAHITSVLVKTTEKIPLTFLVLCINLPMCIRLICFTVHVNSCSVSKVVNLKSFNVRPPNLPS